MQGEATNRLLGTSSFGSGNLEPTSAGQQQVTSQLLGQTAPTQADATSRLLGGIGQAALNPRNTEATSRLLSGTGPAPLNPTNTEATSRLLSGTGPAPLNPTNTEATSRLLAGTGPAPLNPTNAEATSRLLAGTGPVPLNPTNAEATSRLLAGTAPAPLNPNPANSEATSRLLGAVGTAPSYSKHEADLGTLWIRPMADLVALICSCGNTEPYASQKTALQDIWHAVASEGRDFAEEAGGALRVTGKNVMIAGDFFEFSYSDVCKAASSGKWPLCAYLAAMCFRREGAGCLAKQSPEWMSEAWVKIVAPIVVHVPIGQDQDFKEGAVIQPVKFKCVQLPDPATARLMKFLSSSGAPEQISAPTFLNNVFPLVPTRPVWYHVLAYPFGGDVTKALLRPQADSWTQLQRNALHTTSETLVSKCAKAGKWDFVATLLRAGVTYPDLTREFTNLCSHSNVVHQAWQQDLIIAIGAAHGPPSLLELAAWGSAGKDWNENEVSPLQDVMEALRLSNQDLDIGNRSNREPLICMAAGRGHWSVVLELLEVEESDVCARSLLGSRAFASAPQKVKSLAEDCARQEMIAAATKPCDSLVEYFRRQVSGPSNDETVPLGFALDDDGVLRSEGGVQVLDCSIALEPGKGKTIVFVKLESEEMETTRKDMRDPEVTISKLELDGRECRVSDPSLADTGTCWLALVSQGNCHRRDESRRMSIRIPSYLPANAHIMRKYEVHVKVLSRCCREPLAQVPVYTSGTYAGTTMTDGIAKFKLPLGQFTIESPGYVRESKEIVILPTQSDISEVELCSSGELFAYLQDFGTEEEPKDSIFICADRSQIPPDAGSFSGSVTMPGCHGFCVPKGTHLKENATQICSAAMSQIEIRPDDGRRFKRKKDLTWFDDFREECEFAVLFHGTPMRLGDLKAPRSSESKFVESADVGVSNELSSHSLSLNTLGKRSLAKEARHLAGAFGSQRQRANVNQPKHTNHRRARPASAQRRRPKLEDITINGKALSLRSL